MTLLYTCKLRLTGGLSHCLDMLKCWVSTSKFSLLAPVLMLSKFLPLNVNYNPELDLLIWLLCRLRSTSIFNRDDKETIQSFYQFRDWRWEVRWNFKKLPRNISDYPWLPQVYSSSPSQRLWYRALCQWL